MRRFAITFTLSEYSELLRRANFCGSSIPNFLRAACGFAPLDSRDRDITDSERNRRRVSVFFSEDEEEELHRRIAALDPKLGVRIEGAGNYLRLLCGFAPIHRGRPKEERDLSGSKSA
jgi:hypothetical protein